MIVYTLINIFLLPLVVIIDGFRFASDFGKKILAVIISLIILTPLWYLSIRAIYSMTEHLLFEYGITDTIKKVPVSGTSMLPTIQDESEIELHNPKKFGVNRLDIVSFANIETAQMHYVKRVIGLPGEKISLRNGKMYINDEILSEPFIQNNLPTYGNTFISECREYTVPSGNYLVLGDNRTASSDSRVLGFINSKDIDGVIKTNLEADFSGKTTEADFRQKPNPTKIIEMINLLRINKQISPFMADPILMDIALRRSAYLRDASENLKNTDLSKFLDESNYKHALAHEYVTYGNLTEKEITDQIKELPFEYDNFISPKFFQIGVGITQKTDGVCTYPIISVIVTWPETPAYDSEVKKMWQTDMEMLTLIGPRLRSLLGVPGIDQNKLTKAISLTAEMSDIASRIYGKINRNEWLDVNDNANLTKYNTMMEEYKKLMDEISGVNPVMQSGQTTKPQNTNNIQKIIPTPAPSKATEVNTSASRFRSFGQVTVDGTGSITINTLKDNGASFEIKVAFANKGMSKIVMAPLRVQMRNATHVTGVMPAILAVELDAATVRSFDFTIEKLPDPPFTFTYTDSSGNMIPLGEYK